MNPKTADRSDDAACSEFLASYGDYADGMLDAVESERLRRHVEACASCARYDRIVRRGAELARDIISVEPSPDFEQRLQHRIFHEQDTAALQAGRPAGVPTALAVAAMIALLAWSPVLMNGGGQDGTQSARASDAPSLGQPVRGMTPFTGGSSWYPMPATSSGATLAAFPGPHSPLVVTPPAHRRVRTVSAEYPPVE